MDTGTRGHQGINVTPLVDVVLVLLIIFMVATPLIQLGHEARVPPPGAPQGEPIVVRLDADGTLWINRERVEETMAASRLAAVLAGAPGRVAMLAAAGDLPYDRVLTVLDLCRSLGAEVGIVLDELG